MSYYDLVKESADIIARLKMKNDSEKVEASMKGNRNIGIRLVANSMMIGNNDAIVKEAEKTIEMAECEKDQITAKRFGRIIENVEEENKELLEKVADDNRKKILKKGRGCT